MEAKTLYPFFTKNIQERNMKFGKVKVYMGECRKLKNLKSFSINICRISTTDHLIGFEYLLHSIACILWYLVESYSLNTLKCLQSFTFSV